MLGGAVSRAGVIFAGPIVRELDRLRATSAPAREQLVQGIVDAVPPGANADTCGGTIAVAHGGTPTCQRWREVGKSVIHEAHPSTTERPGIIEKEPDRE